MKKNKTNLLEIITNLHALIALNTYNCCKNKNVYKCFITTIRNFVLQLRTTSQFYIYGTLSVG